MAQTQKLKMNKDKIHKFRLKILTNSAHFFGRDKVWNNLWDCVSKSIDEDDRFFIGNCCKHLAWINTKDSVRDFSTLKLK
jgi:hypothetical protein